jgi:hypothetical protein
MYDTAMPTCPCLQPGPNNLMASTAPRLVPLCVLSLTISARDGVGLLHTEDWQRTAEKCGIGDGSVLPTSDWLMKVTQLLQTADQFSGVEASPSERHPAFLLGAQLSSLLELRSARWRRCSTYHRAPARDDSWQNPTLARLEAQAYLHLEHDLVGAQTSEPKAGSRRISIVPLPCIQWPRRPRIRSPPIFNVSRAATI